MGKYVAPEIKDRVAVGDDLYIITDVDGKKKLTPSPTEVSEVGTPINKALLQGLANATQRLDECAEPYYLYWWKRQPTSSSYSEVKSSGYGQSSYHHSKSLNEEVYYLSFKRYYKSKDSDGSYTYATIQYATSVSINQSTGVVSLKNPTTLSITESTNITDSSFYTQFQGKYIKGLLGATDSIFYIPSSATTEYSSWGDSSNTWDADYYGYEMTSSGSAYVTPQTVASVKNTAIGTPEFISSDSSDAYPHDGVSDGYSWAYFGKIYDGFLNANGGTTKINYTSANFSSDVYNISIPYAKFAFVIHPSNYDSYTSYFGIADRLGKTMLCFAIKNRAENGKYNYFTTATITSGDFAGKVNSDDTTRTDGTALEVTHTGLKLSSPDTYSGTIAYMPI